MAAARLHVSVTSPDSSRAKTQGLGPWLRRIAPARAKGDLCIAIVSNRRMRSLNRQFRGKDYATDVLSFPSDSRGFLGDIVIAAGVAAAQAKCAKHSLATELKVLSLHGLLHLLGYDHDADEGRMARAEARLRKKAGLPGGLIERATEGTYGTDNKR
ncbi:MAG: rRNA maturation RNase YbeY [Acidimicrobiia bacterium]|nr:rRNA maturation RNase YbeY [Acidimicrobiia bacterium]